MTRPAYGPPTGAHQRLQALNNTTPGTLPVNSRISLQVTTSGFSNRYLRHSAGSVFTEVVTATSPALLKTTPRGPSATGWPEAAATRSNQSTSPASTCATPATGCGSANDGSAFRRRRHLLRPDRADRRRRFPAVLQLPRLLHPPLQRRGLDRQRCRRRHTYNTAAMWSNDSTWNLASPWAP